MSNIVKAAEDLKAFISKFRGIIEIADTLDSIGNLNQAESEAKNRVEKAKAEAESFEKVAEEKKKIVLKLDDEIIYTKKASEEILEKARQKGVAIIDEAALKGNDIFRMTVAKKELTDKEISSLKAKISSLNDEISEKENVLSSVNKKIGEAREKVSSLFK